MQFIKYIFLCDPMGLIALLLFIVGVAILVTKLVGHYTSLNVKNASHHLSRHVVSVLFSVIFMVVGVVGFSISIKNGYEEINGANHYRLKIESSESPIIKSIVTNQLKGRKYINRMTYCLITREIDRYKKNTAKKALIPGKP